MEKRISNKIVIVSDKFNQIVASFQILTLTKAVDCRQIHVKLKFMNADNDAGCKYIFSSASDHEENFEDKLFLIASKASYKNFTNEKL